MTALNVNVDAPSPFRILGRVPLKISISGNFDGSSAIGKAAILQKGYRKVKL